MAIRRPLFFALGAACTLAAVTALQPRLAAAPQAQTQSPPPTTTAPPKPRPFPGAILPPATSSRPADQPVTPPQAPNVTELGKATIYPSAEFLDSFDAGQGQKILIYGTNMPYDQIVTFYRAQLRSHREIFADPPMHQFDLGRYDERVMAFAPSVVVKDYAWNGSEGYLHVSGATEKRYRTIIQIIPVQPADGR